MSGSRKLIGHSYSKVIELGLESNALTYLRAGWTLVDIQPEHYGLCQTIIVYRLGWLEGKGKPVHPPLRDDPCRYGPSQN